MQYHVPIDGYEPLRYVEINGSLIDWYGLRYPRTEIFENKFHLLSIQFYEGDPRKSYPVMLNREVWDWFFDQNIPVVPRIGTSTDSVALNEVEHRHTLSTKTKAWIYLFEFDSPEQAMLYKLAFGGDGAVLST